MTPCFGDEFDPFVWYRWLLAILGTTYAVVMSARGAWRVALFLSGRGRQKVLLRRVVAAQLVRLRAGPLLGELTLIGLLVAVLALCVWLHGYLGFVSL